MASSELNKTRDVTPEQIREYQTLKARNEWIKMNQKRLDEIESKRLLLSRTALVFCFINLIVSLLILLL